MTSVPPPPETHSRRAIALAITLLLASCSRYQGEKAPPPQESAALKRVRQVFARVPETLAKNLKHIDAGKLGQVTGFGAGDAYPQIWLRDSAWIVDAAAAYEKPEALTSWLDLHLLNAAKNGRLRDWVAKGSAATFREWAPEAQSSGYFAFDTNSNESDQEPSAALAFCRADDWIGDSPSSDSQRDARTASLVTAMKALLRDRTDPRSGLVWSGLTADWGDVNPLYADQKAIYLDARTPRTLALYTNVMVFAALDCLAEHIKDESQRRELGKRASDLKDRIRSAFWMSDRGYFRIRLPFDKAPAGFEDDDARFALGGNALAALFGVAEDAQAAKIFETAERLRAAGNVSTISTVLVPPYADNVFRHPAMREPDRYQNGGQWDWFGAALVRAEFERGHSVDARSHLNQIVSRMLRAGPGIHEWYATDGTPQGSPAYAAAAASIHNAIVKGLLGVTRSNPGYRITLRTAETLLPFEVPVRARNESVVVSQTITPTTIDVEVTGSGPLKEVCSVLPRGALAESSGSTDMALPRSVRTVGDDTLVCADASHATLPLKVRFGIKR